MSAQAGARSLTGGGPPTLLPSASPPSPPTPPRSATLRRRALMMGIARGKVSEGMDFRDEECRLVVIVGVPFQAARDPRVLAKKEYNSAHAARPTGGADLQPGDSWYAMQAFRALNQCVGRCIRHRDDHGAVLLLDTRYQRGDNQRGLSAWVVKSLLPEAVHAPRAMQLLREFYTEMERGMLELRTRRRRQEAQRSLASYVARLGLASGAEALLEGLPPGMVCDAVPGEPVVVPGCSTSAH